MNIEQIWANIRKHDNEIFKTKTGIEFSYHTTAGTIYFHNTNRPIGKSTIQRALLVENMTVNKLRKADIHSNSYVYGILTDPRIIG